MFVFIFANFITNMVDSSSLKVNLVCLLTPDEISCENLQMFFQ